jgi:hypothetical protein
VAANSLAAARSKANGIIDALHNKLESKDAELLRQERDLVCAQRLLAGTSGGSDGAAALNKASAL